MNDSVGLIEAWCQYSMLRGTPTRIQSLVESREMILGITRCCFVLLSLTAEQADGVGRRHREVRAEQSQHPQEGPLPEEPLHQGHALLVQGSHPQAHASARRQAAQEGGL